MTQRQIILTGLIIIILAFQVLVLVILAFFPYVPDPGFSNLNMDTYFFLAPLSIIFFVGLLYAGLARAVAREAIRHSSTARSVALFLSEPFQKILSSARTVSLSDSAGAFKILSHSRPLLIISLLTSVLLALVPYRPDLNPNGTLVGVDSPLYVNWISQMLAR